MLKNKTALKLSFLILTLILLVVFTPVIASYSFDSLTKSQTNAVVVVCNQAEDTEDCYTKQFATITRNNSLEYTLEVLRILQTKDTKASGCHFIGHVVGEEEMKKHPEDWENTIAQLPIEACTGGFLMGALEARKEVDPTFILNAKTIPTICNRVLNTTKKPGSDQTCVHTSGHLLLIEKVGSVSKAIDECNNLQTVFIYECASGVFMENIYRRNLHDHGIGQPLVWNDETMREQMEFCKTFSGVQAQGCWRELSHMLVQITGRDPEKIYVLCLAAPEQTARESCYLHGVSVLLMTAKNEPLQIRELCKPFNGTSSFERCLKLDQYRLEENL